MVEIDGVTLRTEIPTNKALRNNLMFNEGENCFISFHDLLWFDSAKRNLEGFIMATTIQNNHPFNIANVILALSIGILVIVVAVPVLLIFLNSFWVDGQFNITDVVNILKARRNL